MKMVVSDFDKTLFTLDYDKNIEAVNKFVARGNIFVIATGRNLVSIKPDLDEKLNFSYLICNDGGAIYDNNFNVLYRKDIDDDVSLEVFDILKKAASVGGPLIDLTEGYCDVYAKAANAIVARIIDEEKAAILLDKILLKYPLVMGYMSDNWVNIDDISVNKGNGVKKLCEIINYNYADVYAVGDNINDISMCSICHGIAMENGQSSLKDVCEDTCKNVAELINRL
ncbi:MAG: HAD-IIB family hydrolase [Bacilli bacterium]|nr:HAD-IIB family hydrolase [Bacilli bacterium]